MKIQNITWLLFLFLNLLFAGSQAEGQTVVLFDQPGTHSYTVPAGVTEIIVEAWGGGGAGGSATNGNGGGGAGGTYVKTVISVSPGQSFTLRVADIKQAAFSASDNKGNPSWFGNESLLFAEGGNGGYPAFNINGNEGTGAVNNSIGTIVYAGGDGYPGSNSSGGAGGGGAGSTGKGGNATLTMGGTGTPLYGGNGGNANSGNKDGYPGVSYGGGGGGARSKNDNQTRIGGTGAQGLIVITYGGCTNRWTGAIDNDWHNSGNWTCSVPDLTIDAFIPSGLTNYPVINAGSTGKCKNLEIQQGASTTVISNTLQISGSIITSGNLVADDGTIEMIGNSVQVIPQNSFANNILDNLIINNPAGVTLNGTLRITGMLSPKAGNLQTSGFLTLASTATQAALIDGTGNGEVIGITSIERYIPSAFGYKYFSSPFTGALVSEFSDDVDLNASFPAFYTYIENQATTGWVKYVNPEGLLESGKGYAVNFGTSILPKTVTTSGQVTNGTVGPIVLYNHNEFYTTGFNLVGNPYPSPIDWNSSGITKQNIDDALYFFDAGNTDPYIGTYSSYINGISSNGGQANNIIAAQQGFFIHVTDGSYPVEGSITFTNAARVNNLNPVFHKNTVVQPESLIRLSAGFLNSSVNDHMVVYFSNDARTEFDAAYDALKIMNTDTGVPNIYAITDESRELSINALPYPTAGTYVVNLALTAKSKGTIIIKASEILNIPSGYKVFLKDAFTGRIQDLNAYPEYRLEINNESFSDRFKLIFITGTIAQEAFGTASYSAYTKDGNIYLNLKLSEEQVAVSVSDLTGRILVQTNIYGEGHHRIGKLTGAGVYIVSIYTDMGILSKKVYLN